MQSWKQITSRLKVGRLVGSASSPKAYRIVATDDKGLTAERIATGSRIRITRAAIEKADARLESGVLIPRRAINYTVAIETLIISALGPSAVVIRKDSAGIDCYGRPSS